MIKAQMPRLGELTADVWVSENHRREMEVTKNPIEYGSPVADHAYVMARSLTVTFGVSNTPMVDNSSFTADDRVGEARELLFAMQDTAELLTIYTITGGVYENCLITAIGWTTDARNPHAVIFDIGLEEIEITTTKQTEYQPLPADPRTGNQTSATKKRGEASIQSREQADEIRRNFTSDASTNSEQLAKSAAANAQAEKIASTDNRTLLKRMVEMDLGALL